MKFDEMSEKDKVRLLLEHVMGYFISEATATGWKTPEFPKEMPVGFHWPLAFWNTDGECWMIRDIATDPVPFEPFHDLNDAWLIVEKWQSDRFTIIHTPVHVRCTIEFYRWEPGFWAIDETAPRAICKVALRARGVIDTENTIMREYL